MTEDEKREALVSFKKRNLIGYLSDADALTKYGIRFQDYCEAWQDSKAASANERSNTKFKVDGSFGSVLEGHWFYFVPADSYAKQALINGGYLPKTGETT